MADLAGSVLMVRFWMVGIAVALAACGPDDPGTPPEPLSHDEEAIRDADGTVLFHRDSLPDEVSVSEGSTFGSSGQITGVAGPSVAGRVAFTSVGVAHGYGWLLDPGVEATPVLAVFQYGGEVEVVGWDDSGRFAAFVVETPAGSSELRITDTEATGPYPEDRTRPVTLPEAEELSPEVRIYEDPEWEEGALCFTFHGDRRCLDPETAETGRSGTPEVSAPAPGP